MTNRKRAARNQTLKLVETYLDRGEPAQAQKIAVSILLENPDFARGWLAAARVAIGLNDLGRAVSQITKAWELAPNDPAINAYAAMTFSRAGMSSRGSACARFVLKAKAADARDYGLAGAALNMNGHQSSARQCFERALKLGPDNPGFLHNLAVNEKYFGDFDLAEKHLEKAVALAPAFGAVHYAIATMRRQTPKSAHIVRLKSLLERPIPNWKDEVGIRYALGKELNDLGDYEGAFKYYSTGASRNRRASGHSSANEFQIIEQLIERHTAKSLMDGPKVENDASPIFVLGLPRTGSTLIERILGSHPDVVSKGELNVFSMALQRLVSELPSNTRPANAAEAYLKVDFTELGRAYVNKAGERAPTGTRWVDKMPANSHYIGLIIRALPNAKIVYLDRDPRDVAIAIYTTLFNNVYPWSYDLSETVDYLVAHSRMMDHWRHEFPDRILTIAYEDLVSEQEASTKRLLEYCDLPWDDNCLRFFENKSAATTASSTEVREPIFSSSVGRWKNFEPFLGSALERLEGL